MPLDGVMVRTTEALAPEKALLMGKPGGVSDWCVYPFGLDAEARRNYRGKESVAKRSISDCRRAIQIARGRDMTTLGMTVTLGGEQMLITDLRVIDKQWVSGDRRFTPKEKELLTTQARAIIAEDEAFRNRFRAPPMISIKECQEAIAIAGGIPITLRREKMFITELKTYRISKWVSGDRRFTPKEKELLTTQARAIIAENAPLPAPPE